MSNNVTTWRECPRCGKVSEHTVPAGVRAHVACPTCNFRFEISTLVNKIKKGKVGSPTNADGSFDYHSAASHHTVDGLKKRLRDYARIAAWGPA